MLDEPGLSSAVVDRMGKTRALDSTLQAAGKNCNVTWTYRPADGLQWCSRRFNRTKTLPMDPISIVAGHRTVVPLCDSRVMTSTVTTRGDAADHVAGSVRAGLAGFGALSYPCARVGS